MYMALLENNKTIIKKTSKKKLACGTIARMYFYENEGMYFYENEGTKQIPIMYNTKKNVILHFTRQKKHINISKRHPCLCKIHFDIK